MEPSPHKEFPNSSKHREGKKGRKGRSKGKLKKATTESQGVVNQEPIEQSKGLPAFNAKPMSGKHYTPTSHSVMVAG